MWDNPLAESETGLIMLEKDFTDKFIKSYQALKKKLDQAGYNKFRKDLHEVIQNYEISR